MACQRTEYTTRRLATSDGASPGARPRWTERERPPLIDDRMGVMDLEAAGGTGGRKVERHGTQAPLLSLERQILMEKEVTTPPRGGRPAPETQVPPVGARAMPQIFTEVRPRDGGPDRQKDVVPPVDMLVDTVARMQLDLPDLRAENLMLRTPGVPQVVRAPRQAAFTTTKVPRFDGTTSWEQYKQVFDAIVRSNGWDNDTAVLQLFSHLEGNARQKQSVPPNNTHEENSAAQCTARQHTGA